MATTIDVQPQVRMINLEQIRHDANVRELASEDVDALAGSIALLGQITPAIVRPDGDTYRLPGVDRCPCRHPASTTAVPPPTTCYLSTPSERPDTPWLRVRIFLRG